MLYDKYVVYIYVFIYLSNYLFNYSFICLFIYWLVNTYIYIYGYIHLYIYENIFLDTSTHTWKIVCIRKWFAYLCTYIYIYTYICCYHLKWSTRSSNSRATSFVVFLSLAESPPSKSSDWLINHRTWLFSEQDPFTCEQWPKSRGAGWTWIVSFVTNYNLEKKNVTL